MHVSGTRLDVVYEGRFARPAIDFAIAPGHVLKSLVKSVSSRFAINSRDIHLTASHRAGDVRLRVSLFNGSGTFEVDADKFGASFQNALLSEDLATIKDCIQLALEGIAAVLKDDPIADHTIRVMLYLQLLDEPKDANTFLASLQSRTNDVVKSIANDKGITSNPGVRFDLNNEQDKWLFTYEMVRAYRAQNEIFMNASLTCYSGCPFVSLNDRVDYLENLLSASWKNFGMEVPVKK